MPSLLQGSPMNNPYRRMFYQGRKITEDDFAVGDYAGVIFHSNKSYRAAFASADKAEAERKEGKL